MSKIVYVSNESDLEASLHGEHQFTVINPDYVPAVFDGYNIEYCFNETTVPGEGKFSILKHIFHPFKSTYVIYNSSIYMALLNKVMRNHTVAFTLSLSNVKLLRLCQCFLGAVGEKSHYDTVDDNSDLVMENFWSGSEETPDNPYAEDEKNWSPIPYIIGKTEIHPGITVPVWSYYWGAKILTLSDVLDKAFFQAFGERFIYSREGYKHLQSFLKKRSAKITGGNKLQLYDFGRIDYRCRQSIEGPYDVLNCASFVEKVKTVAVDAAQLLRKYEIPTPPKSTTPPVPQKSATRPVIYATPDDPYGLRMFRSDGENSGRYVINDTLLLFSRLVFDYPESTSSTAEPYENALGELATPTPKAVKNRVSGFQDDLIDGMGNIFSFVYKIDNTANSGKVVVCPDDFIIKPSGGNRDKKAHIAKWLEFAEMIKKNKQEKQIGISQRRNSEISQAPSLVAPEINQDKDTADNCVVSPTKSSDAAWSKTLGEENSHVQVIEVDFDCFKGKIPIYRVNELKKEAPQKDFMVRFLAFNAGYKGKYTFAYKQNAGVWLIKDGVCDKDLSLLFKNDNHKFIKNISCAITDIFNPFLQSTTKCKDDPVKKNNSMAQNLLCKRGLRYPKIEDDEALKTMLNNEADQLTNGTDTLQKGAARLEHEAVKRLKLVNEKLKMSMVKLRDNIEFKINLSKDFIAGLKELPEYKVIDAPSTVNQYKVIIDFIIAAYPPK